jgi:Flp pilus assembly protein TadB
MDYILANLSDHLIARINGPLKFRLLLQPSMATFLAIRSGLKDAREGKPAYFWALFTEPSERAEMLKDGWKSMGKLFILASVLEMAFQVIALHWVYPLETLLVAIVLAVVPYVLLRGPVNRIARRQHKAVEEIPVKD